MALAETAPSAATSREVLVFTLGEEEYGIDILKVQEIRGYDSVTRIARAPAFIKGRDQPAWQHRPHCGHAYPFRLG